MGFYMVLSSLFKKIVKNDLLYYMLPYMEEYSMCVRLIRHASVILWFVYYNDIDLYIR